MPVTLKNSSSQMVLPMMVAPAARIFATAAAFVRAGAWVASQVGLPAPVLVPAMSYMSLTAAVSPASGPAPLPATGVSMSWGTKNAPGMGWCCIGDFLQPGQSYNRSNRGPD
jgi:hypothetical protein